MQNHSSVFFDNTSNAFLHLSDYELRKRRFLFFVMNQKILTKIGSFFLKSALKFHFPVNFLLKDTIYNVFCGGENLEEVKTLSDRLYKEGIDTILDYGAEGSTHQKDIDNAFEKIKETILFASKSRGIHADFKVTSLINPVILEKYQSKTPLLPEEQGAFDRLRIMLDEIGSLCLAGDVMIMADAEESWIQTAIDELVYDMMRRYNREKALIYNTVQMYRKEGMALLRRGIETARQEGYRIGIKLVRGAYMEKENRRAAEQNRISPIHPDKSSTDDAFDTAMHFIVENSDITALCCATHNEESTEKLLRLLDKQQVSGEFFCMFAQLLGMSDHITRNLAVKGYKVAKYYPYGPVRMVIPYLLRRASENSSVAGQTSRELQLIDRELKRRKTGRN